ECHEVLHRKLIHQPHEVGASDWNALMLQRADHRRDEGIAAAHDNEDIAGLYIATSRYERLAFHQPALDLFRDAPAELIDRACAGSLFVPRLECLGGLRLGLGLGFPDLDQTRFALAVLALWRRRDRRHRGSARWSGRRD